MRSDRWQVECRVCLRRFWAVYASAPDFRQHAAEEFRAAQGGNSARSRRLTSGTEGGPLARRCRAAYQRYVRRAQTVFAVYGRYKYPSIRNDGWAMEDRVSGLNAKSFTSYLSNRYAPPTARCVVR